MQVLMLLSGVGVQGRAGSAAGLEEEADATLHKCGAQRLLPLPRSQLQHRNPPTSRRCSWQWRRQLGEAEHRKQRQGRRDTPPTYANRQAPIFPPSRSCPQPLRERGREGRWRGRSCLCRCPQAVRVRPC